MALRLVTNSSSPTTASTSDILNSSDSICRMNGVQFFTGPDASSFDRNKPISKLKEKRASFPFIEKAFYDRDKVEKGLNSLTVSKPVNFKNITLRNSLIKGEQLLSYRANNSITETDEILSVETILSSSNTVLTGPTKPVLSNGLHTFTMNTNNVLQRKPAATGTGNTKQNHGYNTNTNGITIKQLGNNLSNFKEEPKYADPLMGASASFQQRLMELSSLEAETIRWERTKKVKKKNKDKDY